MTVNLVIAMHCGILQGLNKMQLLNLLSKFRGTMAYIFMYTSILGKYCGNTQEYFLKPRFSTGSCS